MINETFNKLMDEIKELHNRKNHDYASDDNPYSNFEFAAKIVEQFTNPVDQTFACMIGIKLARLGQLLGKGKEPNNESVRDTMRDLTTYCGIWTACNDNATRGNLDMFFDKANLPKIDKWDKTESNGEWADDIEKPEPLIENDPQFYKDLERIKHRRDLIQAIKKKMDDGIEQLVQKLYYPTDCEPEQRHQQPTMEEVGESIPGLPSQAHKGPE
jgi:hypothetical protein